MTTTRPTASRSGSDRRTLLASCLGNAVEWYDFAVFGVSAAVLARVFFPSQDPATGLVPTFLVFATSFFARPIGALTMGRRADRAGRRTALVQMIVLMTAATTAIGLLPVRDHTSVALVSVLVCCRLLQGLSAGGELSSSVPFMLEHAPPGRRGLWSGWHLGSAGIGLACGSAAVALVNLGTTDTQLHEWGWRVPFLLAAPLGLIGLYLRLRLVDPQHYLESLPVVDGGSLRAALRSHQRALRRGFAASAALSIAFNTWFVFWPNYLLVHGSSTERSIAAMTGLGLLSLAVTAPIAGRLSDLTGRRPVLLAGSVSVAVLALPVFAIADSAPSFVTGMGILVGAAIGTMVVPVFVAEPLPTRLRATGVGATFGLAGAVFGGTAPAVGAVLAGAGLPWGIPVYVAAAAVVGAWAVLRSPESAPRDTAAGELRRG